MNRVCLTIKEINMVMSKLVFQRKYDGKKFKDPELSGRLPSLTDQTDYEPIERLINRLVQGAPDALRQLAKNKSFDYEVTNRKEAFDILDNDAPMSASQPNDVDPVDVLEAEQNARRRINELTVEKKRLADEKLKSAENRPPKSEPKKENEPKE